MEEGPFRDVRLGRLDPRDAVRSQTAAQRVEQLAEVAVEPTITATSKPLLDLLVAEPADPGRGQHDPLHAEAQMSRLHLRPQQRPQVLAIPARPAQENRSAHGRGIDAPQLQVNPPGAALALLKLLRQLRHQFADDKHDRLEPRRGAGQSAGHAREIHDVEGVDRLRHLAGRLVEPPQQVGSEPLGQLRPRQAKHVTDLLDPHLAERAGRPLIEPQGLDGQTGEHLGLRSRGNHRPLVPAEPGHRPGTAEGRRQGRPRSKAQTLHGLGDRVDKPSLAAKEPLATGDIEQQSVRRVGRDDR